MKIYIVTKEGYYTGLNYQISSKSMPHNSTTIAPPKTEDGYIAKYLFEKKEWIIISSKDKEKINEKQNEKTICEKNEQKTNDLNDNTELIEKINKMKNTIENQEKQIQELNSTIKNIVSFKKEMEKSFTVFCNNIKEMINDKITNLEPDKNYKDDIFSLKKELELLKTRMRLKF